MKPLFENKWKSTRGGGAPGADGTTWDDSAQSCSSQSALAGQVAAAPSAYSGGSAAADGSTGLSQRAHLSLPPTVVTILQRGYLRR